MRNQYTLIRNSSRIKSSVVVVLVWVELLRITWVKNQIQARNFELLNHSGRAFFYPGCIMLLPKYFKTCLQCRVSPSFRLGFAVSPASSVPQCSPSVSVPNLRVFALFALVFAGSRPLAPLSAVAARCGLDCRDSETWRSSRPPAAPMIQRSEPLCKGKGGTFRLCFVTSSGNEWRSVWNCEVQMAGTCGTSYLTRRALRLQINYCYITRIGQVRTIFILVYKHVSSWELIQSVYFCTSVIESFNL